MVIEIIEGGCIPRSDSCHTTVIRQIRMRTKNHSRKNKTTNEKSSTMAAAEMFFAETGKGGGQQEKPRKQPCIDADAGCYRMPQRRVA